MSQFWFDPFVVSSTGKLSPTACLQQAALITCLYWNDLPSAKDVISNCGGGQVLVWNFEGDIRHPGFCLFRNGSNFYAIIAGTTNLAQMTANVNGIAGVPYNLAGTVFVHTYFKFAAGNISTQIKSFMPTDPSGIKLSLSGHSMGGSIAFLIANEMAAFLDEDNVEVMTFGEPRSLTTRAETAAPHHYRLVMENDLVANLPQRNAQAWIRASPVAFLGFSRRFSWAHYGDRYNLTPAGSLTLTPDPVPDPLSELSEINSDTINAHLIQTYTNALIREQAASGRGGTNTAIAAIARSVLASAPQYDFHYDLKQSTYIDFPTADLAYYAGLVGVVTSATADTVQTIVLTLTNGGKRTQTNTGGDRQTQAENQTSSSGGIMASQIQVLLFFETSGTPDAATPGIAPKQSSWTEVHFLVNEMALTDALKAGVALAKKRNELLGEGVSIEKVRVSSAIVAGDSAVQLMSPMSTNKDFLSGDDHADFSAIGPNVRYEATDFSRRVAMLSGSPDKYQLMRQGTITDANWLKAFKTFVTFLTDGTWGYRGKIRGDANPTKKITAVANVAGPPLSITLQIPAHGLAQNDAVDITKFKGTGTNPNGVNQHVNVVDANTISLLGYVGNFTPERLGEMRKVVYGVSAYRSIQLEGFTKRKRARPFA